MTTPPRALSLLLLALCIRPASAEEPTALIQTIDGVVFDARGSPQVGASVSCGQVTVRTDANGGFHLVNETTLMGAAELVLAEGTGGTAELAIAGITNPVRLVLKPRVQVRGRSASAAPLEFRRLADLRTVEVTPRGNGTFTIDLDAVTYELFDGAQHRVLDLSRGASVLVVGPVLGAATLSVDCGEAGTPVALVSKPVADVEARLNSLPLGLSTLLGAPATWVFDVSSVVLASDGQFTGLTPGNYSAVCIENVLSLTPKPPRIQRLDVHEPPSHPNATLRDAVAADPFDALARYRLATELQKLGPAFQGACGEDGPATWLHDALSLQPGLRKKARSDPAFARQHRDYLFRTLVLELTPQRDARRLLEDVELRPFPQPGGVACTVGLRLRSRGRATYIECAEASKPVEHQGRRRDDPHDLEHRLPGTP